jgi:hypothetical protein
MGFRQKARVVCKTCNHGWMSDLESPAKRLLPSMMLAPGQALSLTATDQATLAAWSVMNIMVTQAATLGGGVRVIPNMDRRHKTHNQPPDRYRVAIAVRQRDFGWPLWSTSLAGINPILPVRPLTSDDRLNACNAYEAAICVGHFVAYLSASLQDGYVLGLPGELLPALIPVWPTSERRCAWPPSLALTTQTIRDYFTEIPVPPDLSPE